ncbi:MAG: hypothetical protein QOJ91_1745 [Sphingomonadales bacterium]|jgi:hypothetical protein|nr:hypothetical protein [Sphingomonadales bacterium]
MRVGARFYLLVFASLFIGAQVGAQTVPEPSIGTLWRDLQFGQSLQAVSAQLAQYSEVANVKPKPGKKGKPSSLKIGMNKGGIPIYDSAFSLQTTFGADERLREVTLVSGSECANEATGKFDKISDALASKYGDELTERGALDPLMVSSALSESYGSQRAETITYGYANDSVAVAFVLAFSKTRPPEYVGGGSLARALSGIAKGIYDSQRQKCRNSGDETVVYAIKYLSRADFDARAAKLDEERDADDEEADKSL